MFTHRIKKTSTLFMTSVTFIIFSLVSTSLYAACHCGSTDEASPCEGNEVKVVVNGDSTEKSRQLTFTWAFDSNGAQARCGQFANGDYWVAPAENENRVSIHSVTSTGAGKVYVDENPTLDAIGILDKDYGNLDPNQNILTSLPYHIDGDSSLLAGAQRILSCGTKGIRDGCVDAYNTLTILSEVPPLAGSETLRPAISRIEKDLLSWDDFDLTRLPAKDYFSGTNKEGFEEIRKRWTHHTEILSMMTLAGKRFSEGGRAFRADLVTDDYAATVAQSWHSNLVKLMSANNTLEEKKPALAAILTYGKDIYSITYDNEGEQVGAYGSGAGQSLGRFPAAVFFASMAKNNHYADVLSKASQTQASTTSNDMPGIHELDQINVGPNGPVWGDHNKFNVLDVGRYWGEMLAYNAYNGAPLGDGIIRGKKTFRDPHGYIDGPGAFPGILYASVSAGPMKSFAAEMLLMPEICEIVNYDALVTYAIRITDVGVQANNDLCAPPDPRELEECNPYRRTGCKYYGLNNDGIATWGPMPDDLTQCIENGIDPITGEQQQGRFFPVSSERSTIKIGYRTREIEDNWEKIRANRNSCRTLTRPNPPSNFRVQ